MKKEKKKDNNKKSLSVLLIILTILSIICSGCAIYEIYLLDSIENNIRYIVMGVLVLISLYSIFHTKMICKKIKKGKNKKKRRLYVTFLVLYSILCGAIAGGIFYLYGTINNINKKYVTYTSDLVVLSKNNINKIDDVKDLEIAILDDKKSPDGYIIPQEIIKEHNLHDENEIKNYDDYTSMIADLYDGQIDAIFVPDNYKSMFTGINTFENIDTDTKVVISKSKKMLKSDTSKSETESSGKSIKEPFTMLLMGIDSTDEVLDKNAIANGDTLILITFNPKTLNATMLSIPRDSFVPIACWPGKEKNKITHAAGYGTDCMINTIEEYFDINIDYYAKINFKGLVKLVNAVGGVEVDVPKVLCTDNSSRTGEVCIQPGRRTLNGEEALVFARDRKQLQDGDFGRAAHQQEIVKALANKAKTIKNVSTLMDILNTISNSLDTNLTTKQILSFYNIAKDISKRSTMTDDSDIINIEQLFLDGTGAMLYDSRMRMKLWDYVPNTYSRDAIVKAMKVNLGQEKGEVIKTFSFSINKPYEKEVIGKNVGKTSYDLSDKEKNSGATVPNFVGDSEAQARRYANNHGLSVRFVGSGGTVVRQSVAAGTDADRAGTIVLTLSGAQEKQNSGSYEVNTNNNTTTPPTTEPSTPSTEPITPPSGDDAGGNTGGTGNTGGNE